MAARNGRAHGGPPQPPHARTELESGPAAVHHSCGAARGGCSGGEAAGGRRRTLAPRELGVWFVRQRHSGAPEHWLGAGIITGAENGSIARNMVPAEAAGRRRQLRPRRHSPRWSHPGSG